MKDKKKIITIIRWTERIWGLMSIAFMLFMAAGHIFGSEQQNINSFTFTDMLTLTFYPTGVLLGLIIAWKWDGIGGIIAIGSIIGLYVLRPVLILDPLIGALAAPGLLFLIYQLFLKGQKETKMGTI